MHRTVSLFIQINHPKKALIVSPTYSEYEREVRLNGGEVLYYALKEETEFQLDVEDFCNALAAEQADLCVICNPNNPTSTASSPEEMRPDSRPLPGTGHFRHDRRNPMPNLLLTMRVSVL